MKSDFEIINQEIKISDNKTKLEDMLGNMQAYSRFFGAKITVDKDLIKFDAVNSNSYWYCSWYLTDESVKDSLTEMKSSSNIQTKLKADILESYIFTEEGRYKILNSMIYANKNVRTKCELCRR